MTTTRNVIADFISDYYYGSDGDGEIVEKDTTALLNALLSAPDPVRLELAALLIKDCADYKIAHIIRRKSQPLRIEGADTAPLPDDIAGLIEQAETQAHVRWGGIAHEHENCLEWKTAAALRSLAQEVERLTRHCQIANADREHDADEIEKLEQRIRELEGIVAGLDERSTIYERRAHELEANRDDYWEGWKEAMAERDAIRAKTIEECAKWLEDMPEHWRTLAADMRRALAKNAP